MDYFGNKRFQKKCFRKVNYFFVRNRKSIIRSDELGALVVVQNKLTCGRW